MPGDVLILRADSWVGKGIQHFERLMHDRSLSLASFPLAPARAVTINVRRNLTFSKHATNVGNLAGTSFMVYMALYLSGTTNNLYPTIKVRKDPEYNVSHVALKRDPHSEKKFRIIHVQGGARLTLESIIVEGGVLTVEGGGIFVRDASSRLTLVS